MKWLGRTRAGAGQTGSAAPSPRAPAAGPPGPPPAPPAEPDARTGERSLVWLRLAVILAALVPVLFFAGAARLGYVDAVRATSARLDEPPRAARGHPARTP